MGFGLYSSNIKVGRVSAHTRLQGDIYIRERWWIENVKPWNESAFWRKHEKKNGFCI